MTVGGWGLDVWPQPRPHTLYDYSLVLLPFVGDGGPTPEGRKEGVG